MESNSTVEIISISNNEITVAHNDTASQPFSIAFFEVNKAKVTIKWIGTDLNNDIIAIITSFHELNS